MGGLLSALNIGKISMATSQKAIEVTGNNIANVNNENYSRQTPELSPTPTLNYQGYFIGTGVKVSDITRAQDVFVTNQLQEYEQNREALQWDIADLDALDEKN
jgi:flagellar hook-associated protein 1 FlgK